MIRPLAAALALSAILSFDTPISSADSNQGHSTSVLRIHGGAAFPDPDHQDPGPAWSLGGSVGAVLNRNVLLSLSYEHIDLDEPDANFRTRAYDPLAVEIELGLPRTSRLTPRLDAGAGPYFHKDPTFVAPFYTVPHVTRNVLNATFGMYFGGGVSFPITRRTMMDLDFRYHQTVGGDEAIVVATTSLGLRFIFPGRPEDHDGYVESQTPAYAAR